MHIQIQEVTFSTSCAATPPMKALSGARSPRAVRARRRTTSSSSLCSGADAFSPLTMSSSTAASVCHVGTEHSPGSETSTLYDIHIDRVV